MSEHKIKLLDLPLEVLKGIFTFVEPERLFYPLMEVNKAFNELANDPTVMTICFFSTIKVPLRNGGAEFSSLTAGEKTAILKEIFWSCGTNEKIPGVAYYTDGGTFDGSADYFISKIYSEESTQLHSTVRGQNVHIKTAVSSELSSHIDLSDVSKYKVGSKNAGNCMYPDSTYALPIRSLLAQYDPQNFKQFSILKYHDFYRNVVNYTCLLQSFALFVSMEEIDVSHPLIRLFDGIKTKKQMEDLGFENISLQSIEDTHVVEFRLHPLSNVERTLQKHMPGAKLDGVYPLIWGEISKFTVNYLNLTQRIGFRFLLLKLIDSHKSGKDSNIDCHTIALSGNIIRLKNSAEE